MIHAMDDTQTSLAEYAVIDPRLFAPGDGQMPLHIAGRRLERSVLSGMLAPLTREQPKAPSHNAAIHGPRGLGKSVLLADLEAKAKAKGVDAILMAADDIPTPERLFEATLGRKVPSSESATRMGGGKILLPGVIKAGGEASASYCFQGMSTLEWRNALADQCRRRPLLLMIDEAQTLDLTVAKTLLSSSQIIRRQAPFALIIAGTPGLKSHIAKAKTTFWERLSVGDLQLELLDHQSSLEALRQPLGHEEFGLAHDEDALHAMARNSDGYPYFLQLWGDQAERHVRTHGGKIDLGVVEAISSRVDKLRKNIYDSRWAEIRSKSLTRQAFALSEHLSRDGALMKYDDALEIMSRRPWGEAGGIEAMNEMLSLGVLFQPDADVESVSAGIPSFMRYVSRKNIPAPAPAKHGTHNPGATTRGRKTSSGPKT